MALDGHALNLLCHRFSRSSFDTHFTSANPLALHSSSPVAGLSVCSQSCSESLPKWSMSFSLPQAPYLPYYTQIN